MYKAVGSRGSRVSRVLWMLEELGQPYEFVEVKLRSPEAYALNPSGKVPILIDGELKVTDSAAICVYLADKHSDKGMGANPGLAGRAEMDSWMHFAQSELEAPLWNKLRHRFLLPKDVRVDVGPAAAYDFASEIKALDRRLGDQPFALGDRFSAVDVLLGDIGGWARAGRFPIDSERVNAYFDRVLQRPARARAQANGGAMK
ncbi:glutathione S-transferase family protein [Mesorhizobium sp. CA8]|uniref:glutathione S-transferase family protein n=1 Tax=Mesorhizobium sp. CA8 TaxID=2876637 RepID=UPI001CCD22A1|nr:glutathione S-transferase family protein [Mesorhizobium sp. CA8]MBZ9762576.1 glutathione S-transferase family protein [Mesorhizobium sp. CA8]